MAARNERFQRGNAPALIFQLDRIRGKAPRGDLRARRWRDGGKREQMREREGMPVRGKINNYN